MDGFYLIRWIHMSPDKLLIRESVIIQVLISLSLIMLILPFNVIKNSGKKKSVIF